MSNYKISLKNLLTGKKETTDLSYPLFNHESYKILVSINEDDYSKTYRRSARWDFGDGTVIEGPSAIHYYKNPGRYTIKCALYSLEQKTAEDIVTPIQVVVKETIPTELSFIDIAAWKSKKNDFCKNNNLGSLQITTGVNVVSEPKISAHQRETEAAAKRQNYFDICEESNYHLKRYWTFLQEETICYPDGEYAKVMLKPTEVYSPEYIPLYGRFVYSNKKVNLEAFVIVSENNETFKKCKLAPYSTTDLNGSRINNFKIVRKDNFKQLPEGCTEIGKIGFVNIWYKSDYSGDNDIFFEIKKDTLQFDDQTKTVENYLNIPPLGFKQTFSQTLTPNTPSDFLTPNGIYSGSSFDKVDVLLGHNFYKNYTVEAYWASFILNDSLYGENSWNIFKYDESFLSRLEEDDGSKYGCKVTLKETSDFYCIYEITPLTSNFVIVKSATPPYPIYAQSNLVDLDELILPKEKTNDEDVDRLLSAYMQHPMYESADNVKKFFHDILANKDILSYLTTKGTNFIDDNVNHKTCYVDKLLSILEMLDQPVSRYDIAGFGKVNELRDLTRILTMNYSHLFGTVLENEYDIEITPASNGKNVGEKISALDTIFCNENYEIIGYRKNSEIIRVTTPSEYIVVKDNFNYKSYRVSFYDIPSYEFEDFADQSEAWKIKNADFISQVEHVYHIAGYDNTWGWCLNLPVEAQHYFNRANQIDSCYSFYIFIPVSEKIRKYNFVSEDTIPSSSNNPKEQISVDEWNKDFGFTYDCLMKVLTQNLK